MSYIGNPPAEAYTNTVKDSFSGDGSTTAFTLSRPTTTNNVRVVVENVIQDPTVAYGVSGTTLTFTSAPPSGTNNIYVVHLGPAVQTTVPPDGVTVTDLNAYGDGAAALTANRATSDGMIIDLQKDGSSVGSIGAKSGNAYLSNSTNGGIYLGNEYGRVLLEPCNESGTPEDNLHFIGSSTNRWRDLYLSGGVYLGGTGSANYLDDYEVGTFTPTASSNITINTVENALYVKVGDLVTLNIWMKVNITSSSFILSGLPFNISGRTTCSIFNGNQVQLIGNQALGTEIYGYGATTVGTNDDVWISFSYRVS